MITTRYYYDKLSQRDKKIYIAIYDGIMHYKPYVEVPGVNLHENTVGWIYHCVLWDNPFIFSVGEYAMWHAVSSDKSRIKMTTLCDTSSEKKYRKQIEDEVNKILSVPGLQKMTDFQKEVFVHDFVINNIQYDHTLGDGGAKRAGINTVGDLMRPRDADMMGVRNLGRKSLEEVLERIKALGWTDNSQGSGGYTEKDHPGRAKCDQLREIRKKIAKANGIDFEPAECHHTGPCMHYWKVLI